MPMQPTLKRKRKREPLAEKQIIQLSNKLDRMTQIATELRKTGVLNPYPDVERRLSNLRIRLEQERAFCKWRQAEASAASTLI
ncbi:hypothetical protein TWF718_011018 [Orbilia javanica]|uniref:Uncharacterized protein n=1 Tax=Orbilia javanica TaxID=47235 RepID=A0AAN8RAF2_9PEZI